MRTFFLLCNTDDVNNPSKNWRIVGLFSSRKKAVDAKQYKNEFITAIKLDEIEEQEIEFPVVFTSPIQKSKTEKITKTTSNKDYVSTRRNQILNYLKNKDFLTIQNIAMNLPEHKKYITKDLLYLFRKEFLDRRINKKIIEYKLRE